MATFAKAKLFYILVGFCLTLGVECEFGWSNHILTIKMGGSVTIPCHYDEKYTQQKKYWRSEIDRSNTYTNTMEKNLSVIDHPDQSLFTVMLRDLQNNQTGDYYCFVEAEGQTTVTYELYIIVQSAPDVSVVSSSVSGHEGGDISVQCLYSSGYQYKLKRWCRYKDQSCYTVGRTDTSQNPSVQISDDDERRSFTVLMTGLRLTDSGWYFCAVENKLNPVHLTVTKAKPDKEKYTNEPLSVWLPVSAVLLLLLIRICVFFWRWRRRPKEEQDQHQIIERSNSTIIDRISSKPEAPVIYSTINDDNPNDPNKDITYYSTIDNVPGSEAEKPPAGGVIYSIIYNTVGPH